MRGSIPRRGSRCPPRENWDREASLGSFVAPKKKKKKNLSLSLSRVALFFFDDEEREKERGGEIEIFRRFSIVWYEGKKEEVKGLNCKITSFFKVCVSIW